MTKEEFFNNNTANEVRGNSNLMAVFISIYEEHFGHKPTCSGCAFKSEFNNLKNAIFNKKEIKIKNKKMEKKDFKIRVRNAEILSYKNEKGKIVRKYDNALTNDFVVGFLTHGTPEQIAERKKLFSILPAQFRVEKKEVKKEIEEVDLREEYFKIFGKEADKRMKDSTVLKKINEFNDQASGA